MLGANVVCSVSEQAINSVGTKAAAILAAVAAVAAALAKIRESIEKSRQSKIESDAAEAVRREAEAKAHAAYCQSILIQQRVCRRCVEGFRVRNCTFSKKPEDCPDLCNPAT